MQTKLEQIALYKHNSLEQLILHWFTQVMMLQICSSDTLQFDLLAPEFELIDPTPDIHALFQSYDALFFFDQLGKCEVKWSSRMTLCAGLCSYQPRTGFCSIRLSAPLLRLRPRSDLINTLLHEMIHAFLFLSSGVRDHDDHGPSFQGHMTRINSLANTKITVFHTFHQEVDAYRLHWWQCDGICRTKKPYFGLVKRAMNRPPSKRDTWWAEHQRSCGGTFTKIKEPEDYKKKKVRKVTSGKKLGTNSDITSYFTKTHKDVSMQRTEASSIAGDTQQSSILADRKIVLIDLTEEG
uniref:Uncharacterized protein AlNc14C73G4988 n=1 Tax=Albugo laibachii Nc14 TaxID=890382 RepID=F0WED1_9STRA|nr:conserved hypothetical protein [Albugo laibachii Nc14]|eukprot:CCA19563.1 conserved hypothetical protein [Albugo laibachii Nc14]